MTTARQAQAPASPRIARKRSRRRAEILAVAAELFAERGYDAVALDDVAARLDVTKASLYYYFSGKDELATAAIEALGDEWMTRLERLGAAHDGPASARLRALVHENITIAVTEHPHALRMFVAPRAWPQPQAERIHRLRRRHDAIFRSVIEQGVATGEFSVISVDIALQCMHAAMTQAPVWCTPLAVRTRARAIDQLCDTLMLLMGPAGRAAVAAHVGLGDQRRCGGTSSGVSAPPPNAR
ncbi:hypothetical protein GCM10022240_03830 [Microbacterium kribbense]|uniref:HTH tetR-type domain-containing protein n=1 Tax=Microbacterium kribbense TaxID=433645 RepID=A0ABP7G4B4_9MICO